MTSNFLNTAYSKCWLGQSMPAFTTEDYMLAPFAQSSLNAALRDTTITSKTTRFWTELRCWAPASIELNYENNLTTFSDGRGCIAKDILSFSPGSFINDNGTYEGKYYGGQNPYYGDTDWPGYCKQFPHILLMTWRYVQPSGTPPDYSPGGDATAMFCEPEYLMEEVEATIAASNGNILSYDTIGQPQTLTDDLFNRTNFESIITNGRSPIVGDGGSGNSSVFEVDIADGATIDQGARLFTAGVSATQGEAASSAMLGFALGASGNRASDLINFDKLQQAYTQAHKLLFALAMAQNFDKQAVKSQEANQVSTSVSVHLVPAFTIATESLLVLTAALCASLLWVLPQRPLKLSKDPDSFAAIMSICRLPEVQNVFSRLSDAHERVIEPMLHGKDFSLECYADNQPVLRQAASVDAGLDKQDKGLELAYFPTLKPQQPLEISWMVSGAVLLLIAGGTGTFFVLDLMSEKQNGLKPPTGSELVQQLLLSFIPTAFATLLGAYLGLVARSHSFVQPLDDLYDGNAPAANTLLVKYTSLPPQLLFVRAFQAGHHLLALLSISALLSNILTVTVASMFLQRDVSTSLELELPAMYQPNVINVDIRGYRQQTDHNLDAIYATAANLSSLTSLPPWTTFDHGYLPFDISSLATSETAEYEFETIGYGADLSCVDLLSPSSGIDASLDFDWQGQTFRLWANYSRPEGGNTTCLFLNQVSVTDDGFGAMNGELDETPSAFEISNNMWALNASNVVDVRFCSNITVKGWVRGQLLDSPANHDKLGTSNFDHNATVVSCTSHMKAQQHRLRTSGDGRILSAIPIGPVEYDLPPTVNLTSTLLTATRATTDYFSSPIWHKDLVARDWSNYLYKKTLNNTDLLDAAQPVPSFETASKLMKETFTRLFALQVAFDHDRMLPLNTSVKTVSTWDTSAFPDEAPGPYTVPAKVYYPERRIFISQPNFIVSVTILSFDFLVLLVFRLRLRKPFLPRMPFTIASQIAFFSGSHVIDDVVKAGGDLKELDKRGFRYGYGRYIGKDGWMHVGIEREPFVSKLHDEEKDLKHGKRHAWWFKLMPWLRKDDVPRTVRINGFEFESIPQRERSKPIVDVNGGEQSKSDIRINVAERDGNWI
ncbi:hypothetical protein OHC33_008898 [Knufia fluminis]|uniref:Uncharacterized protein n=1 Tax=Knufia fluminis TaxID=191047 RepID=A0AAN8EFB0_9EURO|nr:hypothetical protein OHC33_008898 [Knufia fluminis]